MRHGASSANHRTWARDTLSLRNATAPAMISDPAFYAAALPAVILYGLSKGGFAGVSLLAIPLMALIMSPVQAAAILLPVLLVQDAVTVYTFRNSWDRKTLTMMLPGAAFGIALGALTAAIVSTAHIRLAVGLLAVAFCLNAWFGPNLRNRPGQPHDAPVAFGLGTIAGYTSFVIHAGGPPYNMYTLPRLRETSLFVGTSALFFGLVNLAKLPPYWLLGQFTASNLILSALLVPVAVLGNLAGIWLVRRMPTDVFYKIIYGLTFAIGAKLVVDGLVTLHAT